jgi:outer membrane protein assembly factor BamB
MATTTTMLKLLLLGLLTSSSMAETNWPQFRGPRFDNNFPGEHPPAEFGPEKNLKWKVTMSIGHSSPIVLGERLIIAGFDGEVGLETIAIDRNTGALLWRQAVRPEKLESYFPKFNNPAASTPASDGERIVSYFGSFGFVCYDLDGKELWRRPMPIPDAKDGFGTGSSPIIHDGKIFLIRDEQGPGQGMYAIDVRNGKDVWHRKRDGFRISFGSPVIWDGCVVAAGDLRLKAYDLNTGADRWVITGLSAAPCTTPAPGADGNLYVAVWNNGSANEPNIPPWEKMKELMDKDGDGKLSPQDCEGTIFGDLFTTIDHNRDGFIEGSEWNANLARMFEGKNSVMSIRPGGRGDVTKTHVRWQSEKGAPGVASPLVYDGLLYLVKDGGMLTVYEADSGKLLVDRERLGAEGDYYASPIAVDGKIYAVSQRGVFICIEAGVTPSVLWTADFGEPIAATPVVAANTVYVRSQDHVWAFGEK